MQNHNVDYVENDYICAGFSQNCINLIFLIMEKRVFKSVPVSECVGTVWNSNAVVRASLNQLLDFFSLSISSVIRSSYTDNIRYVLCVKTDGLPAFKLSCWGAFQYGRKYYNDLIDWHLCTFNPNVAFRTCKCLRTFGLDVDLDIFEDDFYHFNS